MRSKVHSLIEKVFVGQKTRVIRLMVSETQRSTAFPLGRTTFIAMMQATNFRYLHHRPKLRRLHGAGRWSVLAQRQMSVRLLAIFKVAAQNPSQVLLSQHNHVV